MDETLVSVHINPYFLRLNFSNSLVEDDASFIQYDPSSGYLTLVLSKENAGQHFEDLDLLAKLLAPRPTVSQPMIEIVPGDHGDDDDLIARTEALSLEQDEFLQGTCDNFQFEIRAVKTSRGY